MEFSMDQVLEEMARMQNVAELRALRDRIQRELQEPSLSAHSAPETERINDLHDEWIRYAVRAAEASMMEEGRGRPPKPYALLLFGSGGRREQTLWSDQDNGLIYEDPLPGEEEDVAAYFEAFAVRVVDLLEQLGYPPCEGNVLCSNGMWRQSLSGWKTMLQGWVTEPSWENIRYLLIQADSRSVYGEADLERSLKAELVAYTTSRKGLLEAMLRNTLRRKVSLGVLGNLIPERFGEDMGGIDIKYGAYIPFVNGIRLLALRHGHIQSGTLERIDALADAGLLSKGLAEEWRHSFFVVLRLRSLTTHRLEDGFYQSGGILPGRLLTKERKKELKAALRSAQRLHKYAEKEIRQTEMEMEKG